MLDGICVGSDVGVDTVGFAVTGAAVVGSAVTPVDSLNVYYFVYFEYEKQKDFCHESIK